MGNPALDHHDACSKSYVVGKSCLPMDYGYFIGREGGNFPAQNFFSRSACAIYIFFILLTLLVCTICCFSFCFYGLEGFLQGSCWGNFSSHSPTPSHPNPPYHICDSAKFCFRKKWIEGSLPFGFYIFTVFLRPLKLLLAHG